MRKKKNLYRSEEGSRRVADEYRGLLRQWPVPYQPLRLATRAGETFVVACGDEAARPLLLLHGGGANSAMWLDSVATWAARFRVYAVDVVGEPGFSASSRPALASDAYASWLDDVLQALSLAQAVLVGASFGGWLALDYATRRAERVDRLVLLGPMGVGRVRASFLVTTMPLLLFGDWGRGRALRNIIGPMPTGAALPDGRLLSLVQKHFRSRMEPMPIFPDEALHRLTMPVMAIVGDRDAIADSAQTKRRLEAAARHAEVRYLPEVGHRIFGQCDAILAFLCAPAAA